MSIVCSIPILKQEDKYNYVAIVAEKALLQVSEVMRILIHMISLPN